MTLVNKRTKIIITVQNHYKLETETTIQSGNDYWSVLFVIPKKLDYSVPTLIPFPN